MWPARSVARPPMTPKRPGSPRVARAPTVKRGVPAASKAWTTPEYWSATHTGAPPGGVAIAGGNRKTPAPCGGSPTTDGLSAGGGAAGAAAAGRPANSVEARAAIHARRDIIDVNVAAAGEVTRA